MNFNYNDYQQQKQNPAQTGKKEYKVQYFSLYDDKDEAIVRFPYTSTAQLEVPTVHSVQVGNYYKKINCLRASAYDPLDNCPFCASGNKITSRAFIKMVTYIPMQNGTVKPQAVVWDRPKKFLDETIVGLINKYSTSLPGMLFKVVRHGVHNDMKTKYSIELLDSSMYPDNIYVPDFSAFDNFDLKNHFYYTRTADEMKQFLATGEFPQAQKNYQYSAPQQQTYVQPQSVVAPTPVQPVVPQPVVQPAQPGTLQTNTYSNPVDVQTVTTPTYITPGQTQSEAPRRYTY